MNTEKIKARRVIVARSQKKSLQAKLSKGFCTVSGPISLEAKAVLDTFARDNELTIPEAIDYLILTSEMALSEAQEAS